MAKSGRRDSNARHLPWQGNALPLSYTRIFQLSHHHTGGEKCQPFGQKYLRVDWISVTGREEIGI
jgi:hypothetical protein